MTKPLFYMSEEKYPFEGRLSDVFQGRRRSIRRGITCQVIGETRNGKCYKLVWPTSKKVYSYLKSFIERVPPTNRLEELRKEIIEP